MLKPSVRLKDSGEAALARLTGREDTILNRRPLPVNALVSGEVLTLSEAGGTEMHGRLLHLPLDDDGQQAVQLSYFLPADTGEAAVYTLRYHPDFFRQWSPAQLAAHPAFRLDRTAEQQFGVDAQTGSLLESLLAEKPADPLSRSLLRTETATQLLRRALEAVAVPFTACPVPACRFLAYEAEREKIFAARDLLLAGTERPLTIKELARKVAMNECYLKKGFKALTGKTVHEFQHERRMSRAQELLREGNRSVSDVAAELGFLSISHFSTAFKKATGMKACELLR